MSVRTSPISLVTAGVVVNCCVTSVSRAEDDLQLDLETLLNNSLFMVKEKALERKTASLGIAGCPGDAQSVEALIQRADEDLHGAKKQGKNQVCAC